MKIYANTGRPAGILIMYENMNCACDFLKISNLSDRLKYTYKSAGQKCDFYGKNVRKTLHNLLIINQLTGEVKKIRFVIILHGKDYLYNWFNGVSFYCWLI